MVSGVGVTGTVRGGAGWLLLLLGTVAVVVGAGPRLAVASGGKKDHLE